MNRRAIAILGAIFLLIVGTLGFLLYQRQHKSKVEAGQTENTNANTNTVSDVPPVNTEPEPTEAGDGKAVKLSDDEVISPVLFFQGNGITFLNSQGELFQTDLKSTVGNVLLSNKREITIALKSGLSRVLWPQAGNNFIAEIGTGSNRSWSFYDSSKNAYLDLPSGVTSVAWLPSGEKIMFTYVDKTGAATLNTSNPDGSGYATVAQMYEGDDDISVSPDGKSVLFWRTQSKDSTNIISFLSPDGKVYKALITDGFNVGVNWSPDSSKFVFGRRDPSSQKYQLWLGDINTGGLKNLGVETIPSKVVWTKSGNFIYAAVPTTGSAGDGLTQDTIMKINAVSGDKQEYNPGTTIDAENLFLDPAENNLLFKNNQDHALYYMDVSK